MLKCDPWSRRFATAITRGNINYVHHMMMDDRRLTIYQLNYVYSINISFARIETILHKALRMMKVCVSGFHVFLHLAESAQGRIPHGHI